MSAPCAITEYAFSGSLCRIREFETSDGLRYCLTVFNLSNFDYLHFPHDEYRCLINQLHAHQSTQAILLSAINSDVHKLNDCMLSVKHTPFVDDFKIKLGVHDLKVGIVTVFGLLKTAPFAIDVSVTNHKQFTCDREWDICACKSCPIFKHLIDCESTAYKLMITNIVLDGCVCGKGIHAEEKR